MLFARADGAAHRRRRRRSHAAGAGAWHRRRQTLALVPGVSRSGATIAGGDGARASPRAAARFTFLLAMPAMLAGAAKEVLSCGTDLGGRRSPRSLVGMVMLRVVGYSPSSTFIGSSRRIGSTLRLVPDCARRSRPSLASPRLVSASCSGCAAASSPASSSRCRWSSASWRSSGSSGLSTASSAPFYASGCFGRARPGLGSHDRALRPAASARSRPTSSASGVLQRAESYLLRVPVFRTVYAPVKQLVSAFSPDNEFGFKRMVLVEDRRAASCSGS